jgi:hypothetical protein
MGGRHKVHSQISRTYIQAIKDIQASMHSKLTQKGDIALNFTKHNHIKGLQYYVTQATLHQTNIHQIGNCITNPSMNAH